MMFYKKIIFAIIFLFFPVIAFAQVAWQWMQTVVWQNWGLWAPWKTTTQAPTIAVAPEWKIWVGLSDINNLNDAAFASGDVVAKRYCFEWTKECASTFQQSFTNNQIFTLLKLPFAFQDEQMTIPYTDTTKPMFIRLTPDILQNQIGMENETTSNWVQIAHTNGFRPYISQPKQLWWHGNDNLTTTFTHRVNNAPFIPGPTKVLRSCYRTIDGIPNRYSHNFSECTDTNATFNYHLYCDVTSEICGVASIEMRLANSKTLGLQASYADQCNQNNIYSAILRTNRTSSLSFSSLRSTGFEAPSQVFNPSFCNSIDLWPAIEMRFILLPHINGGVNSHSFSQYSPSLVKLAQQKNLSLRIDSVGVMIFR